MQTEKGKHVHIKYNRKLKAIADSSALIECAIPVYVCDENLYTCMVSKGARKQLLTVSVGKNLVMYFTEDAVQKIAQLDCGTMLTTFSRGSNYSNVIVTSGQVDGEHYIAIIFEPQIMFIKTPAPWYINEAFETVRTSVDELISSPRVCVGRLEWYCAMLSRLCSFHVKLYEHGLYSINHSPESCNDIDIIMSECGDIIKRIGGETVYSKVMYKPFLTHIRPRLVFMSTTMLVIALVLISGDGIVNIDCRYEAEHADYLEISHSAVPDPTVHMPINSIDELLKSVPHLRLDIAALADMLAHINCPFNCKSDGRKLTITYQIPAVVAGEIQFRKPDDHYLTEMRQVLDRLCTCALELIRDNK